MTPSQKTVEETAKKHSLKTPKKPTKNPLKIYKQ
jgi:hypothetical protein